MATGGFEVIAAPLTARTHDRTASGLASLAIRLLKYYSLVQLLLAVLALLIAGVASPLVVSDVYCFRVMISLLAFLEIDSEFQLARDCARKARRAAAKSPVQKVSHRLEQRELV